MLTAFSYLCFEVLHDDVPLKNSRWAYDIVSRSHTLNLIAQTELYTFLDQLPLLLHWHRNNMAICEALDEIFATYVHTQYEAENLLDEYADFKNSDSA